MKLLQTIVFGLLISCSSVANSAEFSVLRQYVKPILVGVSDGKGNWKLQSHGSGIVIAPGYVLTAHHVVMDPEGSRISVVANNNRLTARVVKADEPNDLALLYVPAIDCPCIQVSTRPAEIDAEVFHVGYPLYAKFPIQYLTHGFVQDVQKGNLFITTNIAPGSSGGGVFTKEYGDYKLIGVITSAVQANQDSPFAPRAMMHWMALATPADIVRRFLKHTGAER